MATNAEILWNVKLNTLLGTFQLLKSSVESKIKNLDAAKELSGKIVYKHDQFLNEVSRGRELPDHYLETKGQLVSLRGRIGLAYDNAVAFKSAADEALNAYGNFYRTNIDNAGGMSEQIIKQIETSVKEGLADLQKLFESVSLLKIHRDLAVNLPDMLWAEDDDRNQDEILLSILNDAETLVADLVKIVRDDESIEALLRVLELTIDSKG